MTTPNDEETYVTMVGFICFKCKSAGIIGYEECKTNEFCGQCPECGEDGPEFVFMENPDTIVTGVDELFHFHKRDGKMHFESLVPKKEIN
jgi:hypothetical protein